LTPFKKVYIKDSAVEAICYGAQVAVPGIAKLSSNIVKNDLVLILSLKGELIALGKALLSSEEIEELSKGLAVKVERVIMPKGTYPKMWK
ncbi:MAG: PUA domain-containing protein, partial [Nitrososphaeria archaeon]